MQYIHIQKKHIILTHEKSFIQRVITLFCILNFIDFRLQLLLILFLNRLLTFKLIFFHLFYVDEMV